MELTPELDCKGLRFARRTGGNEDRIVAANRSNDFRDVRLIEGNADKMGRARGRSKHDQIGCKLDRAHPIAKHGGKPRIGVATNFVS